jgi:hypothetical protein
MPVDHNANQKGGPPDPYPLPNPPLPAQDMTGIGKPPEPEDTSGDVGAIEKDARAKAYRTLGTS